jgi:hypothetical protein
MFEVLMRKIFLIAVVAVALSATHSLAHTAQPASPSRQAAAQGDTPQDLAARVPPPKASDVKSIDSLLAAVYDVISGPAGTRDWNRFRSLFVPEARLTSTVKRSNPTSGAVRFLTVEAFVWQAGAYFSEHPFYESAIVNRVRRFGNIADVFSSYESRNAPGEKPFTRGINSMQFFYDGSR